MRALLALALLPLAASVSPSARADEPPAAAATPPPPVEKKPEAVDHTHRLQFGVAVTVGTGYRVLFKYDSAETCGNGTNATCYGRVPTWLDLKAFFGVHRNIDLVVEQRFGLETDFIGSHQLLIMPGIRIYPEPDSQYKFYVQIQLMIDYTSDPTNIYPQHGVDVGFHEANGFQWDFLRWMGVYFQISETFGFLRSFDFQLEAGAGVEGRFP